MGSTNVAFHTDWWWHFCTVKPTWKLLLILPMHFTAMTFQDAVGGQLLGAWVTWKWIFTVGGMIHDVGPTGSVWLALKGVPKNNVNNVRLSALVLASWHFNCHLLSVIFMPFVTSYLGLQEKDQPQTTCLIVSHSWYHALWDVKLLSSQTSSVVRGMGLLCWSYHCPLLVACSFGRPIMSLPISHLVW